METDADLASIPALGDGPGLMRRPRKDRGRRHGRKDSGGGGTHEMPDLPANDTQALKDSRRALGEIE